MHKIFFMYLKIITKGCIPSEDGPIKKNLTLYWHVHVVVDHLELKFQRNKKPVTKYTTASQVTDGQPDRHGQATRTKKHFGHRKSYFQLTYILSFKRVTHSSAFILSRASSSAVNDVATRSVGWNGL